MLRYGYVRSYVIVQRPKNGPPPVITPKGDSVDAVLSTLHAIYGVLFSLGAIGSAIGLMVWLNNEPSPGLGGIGVIVIAFMFAAVSPIGLAAAIVYSPKMLRGDRSAYRVGGWLCIAPLLVAFPTGAPIFMLAPNRGVAAFVFVIMALWLTLGVALISRSLKAPAGGLPHVPASNPAAWSLGAVSGPVAVPVAGPGPHDKRISEAFRYFSLFSAATSVWGLAQVASQPRIVNQPALLTPAFGITLGVFALLGVLAAYIFPPKIAIGDLRVIRILAILMLIPAIPSAIGLLLSILSPFAFISMVASLAGLAQIAWLLMAGLLTARGFTPRLN